MKKICSGTQYSLSGQVGICARIMCEGKAWEGLEPHRETLSLWVLRRQQMAPLPGSDRIILSSSILSLNSW